MNKLVKLFMGFEGVSEREAKAMFNSLKGEVNRTLDGGDFDSDNVLDELECIFANYELELDWLDYVMNTDMEV